MSKCIVSNNLDLICTQQQLYFIFLIQAPTCLNLRLDLNVLLRNGTLAIQKQTLPAGTPNDITVIIHQ